MELTTVRKKQTKLKLFYLHKLHLKTKICLVIKVLVSNILKTSLSSKKLNTILIFKFHIVYYTVNLSEKHLKLAI